MGINTMSDSVKLEANRSATLNAFMYLNYEVATTGNTINKTLDELSRINKYSSPTGEYYKEYTAMCAAVKSDSSLGNLEITNKSWDMGYNSGTNACTFTDPSTGDITVAFRGTDDGEWLDNGIGMTEVSTEQQEQARKYFDEVAENYINKDGTKGFSAEQNITTTGHSKGGNKTQYIMLTSIYGAYIDKAYSMDGQGFSPEAIEAMKEKYGEEYYYDQLDKTYSICGENDYVNGLGKVVISKEHTYFISTPDGTDVAGYHDILNMITGDQLNGETEQGLIGKISVSIAQTIMDLPIDQRRDTAITIMQILEGVRGDEYKNGLNGEKASFENIIGAIANGFPEIIHTLFTTDEGKELLGKMIKDFYEEKGALACVAAVVVVAAVAVILYPVVKIIQAAVVIVDSVIDLAHKVADFTRDVYDVLVSIGDTIKEFGVKLQEWYNKNLNAGYKYASENTQIMIDTYKLRSYADRLIEVNRKIYNLEDKLKDLYSKVDLDDLWNLIKADALTGYSWRLNRCANYLNDSATYFEDAESNILAKL